jgi:single-strand DNA-binding protein
MGQEGLNRAEILGNIGGEVELRETKSKGTPYLNLSIATNERRRNADGDWTDEAEWHNVIIWGKRAKALATLLKRGRTIYVAGRMETKKWEDSEGIKRQKMQINADQVILVGSGRD